MEIFKANILNKKHFGSFVIGLSIFIWVVFAVMGETMMSILAFLISLAAFLRLQNRKMQFTNISFLYDGWFRSHTIRYHHIQKVEHAANLGYPLNRIHGGEYQITTKQKRYWVSLLWFDQKASKQFHKRIVK